MKQLPHVAAAIYGMPWAIRPESHAELGRLYRSYVLGALQPAALETSARVSSGVSYQLDRASGIAVLALEGIICKRAPDIFCGPQLVDLSRVDQVLDEVMEDNVQTLVLDINSPGGCFVGLQETADKLREVAERVRMVAYTDYEACSAAYWIACAADEIYCAPSAVIGSIGSYIAGLDDSRAWEMEGLQLKLARSGELKALGHPGKAWTEEEMQFLERTNAVCGAEFRSWVTSRRGDVPMDLMQGQWFFGKTPEGLALHDGLRNSLKELLGELMASAAE
jgi:protease-4